ncbi:unnamed protein product [Scytosiphon promiscuus]
MLEILGDRLSGLVDGKHETVNAPPPSPYTGGMTIAEADPAIDSSAADYHAGGEGNGELSSGGGGGSWQEGVDFAKATSDGIINFVADMLARHGWTMILVVIVWYNCKDPVKRRYRQWRNKRSLADANRPDRRAVLDRERARSVAEKQREALEAARAAAARQKEQKMQSYAKTTASTTVKED